MIQLFIRHLYLRIWLASLAGVAVVVIAAGWAWQISEEQRSTPLPREVTLRDDKHEISGRGTSLRTSRPGEGLEFEITLEDGRRFTMEFGPRYDRRSPPPWLHPQTGIFWLLGMVGLATGVGLFPIVRRLTQRLESLQRGVQRWGEGDLSARVPEDGEDEVADLAQRFNDAATRIEQLIRSHKSLLANASHELRSPLTRIRMSLELMAPPSGSPVGSAQKAAIAEVARSIAELDQLIDEILLASRLDAREADMGTVESVDLMGLAAEECAHTGAELGVAEGTKLEALTVPGVPRLLRRAVRNLLENARRYGGQQGVEVDLSADARHALVRVMDRGPGVPEALRERIFEPFYRLPGASEREGGVGLGLALVKSIIERHGGQVRCEGREGGGACFVIALPH
ncbi:HAMP domain-containing sensor histidine kinase [Xenophilus arseniciresistens]|uniref:histidine kinase n=1 Tax=Xenophilus arseniciresistens TaxID=1283306 RepID=A0AAE3T0P6_9BURK|nr:HAMP domain-containing sensor histidine kinase [Xenophilus arseniciresistens]MDA7418324.1 HAMP domain-containing sensor histidine kinase [Xenophilus arseniciresistens]